MEIQLPLARIIMSKSGEFKNLGIFFSLLLLLVLLVLLKNPLFLLNHIGVQLVNNRGTIVRETTWRERQVDIDFSLSF